MRWPRWLGGPEPPTSIDTEEIRRQLARVRELDRQHRKAFDHLLRLFDWEIFEREHGYYEAGRDDIPSQGAEDKSK